MKKYITILLVFSFSSHLLAQDTLVTKKEFQEFRASIQDSILKIGERVDDGSMNLSIAQKYTESADDLVDRFINMTNILYAIAGFLLAGLIAIFYNKFKTEFETTLAKKINEYEEELNRLATTERETIFLKENAGILILHKGSHLNDNAAFKTLENSIERNYTHAVHASVNSLKDFSTDIFSKKGIKENHLPKVILLDDDLFEEFKSSGKTQKDNPDLIEFINMLEENKIGLVLFGQTILKDFNLSYLAFANQSYSVYANLNNLLKYMLVAENIKTK